jgi:hypothetical protein
MGEAGRNDMRLDRRSWMAAALASCLATTGWGDEASETEGVEEQARKNGLTSLRTMRSKHFLAIGNAPDDFLRLILVDCETVALDFMDHFQKKGFAVAFPADRLTAVVLADERDFARFLGRSVDLNVLGIYLARQNWLVLQDFRHVPMREQRAAATNLRTLAHEATHQLCFNTGLLNRRGDAPGCVVEGLGAYGEIRKPNVRMAPGQVNYRQLDNLAHKRRGLGWTAVDKLLTDDVLRRTADAHEVALYYAQSWLLVHYMMSEPERVPQLRNYLEAIKTRTNPEHRLDDARSHWGDLDRLDRDLKRYAVRLLTAR